MQSVLRLDIETVGQDVRLPPCPIRRDLHLRAEERPQVTQMPLPDGAQADEEKTRHATERARRDFTTSRFRRAFSW